MQAKRISQWLRDFVSEPEKPFDYQTERFITRANALFYARLAFLSIGLGVLALRPLRELLGARTPAAYFWYLFMIAYSVANYMLIGRGKLGRAITFFTLNFDLVCLVYLTAFSGGLASPVIIAQIMFTIFFAILFPKPLAILPPLLALLIVARIDQLLPGRAFAPVDLFLLLWYFGVNLITVYVIVYLNQREMSQHTQIVRLKDELKDLAIAEERNRLAREIHDGLGASLSSLIIQAEYLQSIAADGALRTEVSEMKAAAEEGMEDLRRSVSMMREDFDLKPALEDYCATFESRSKIRTSFTPLCRERKIDPEIGLALFRILQEALTNVAKHSQAKEAEVALRIDDNLLELSVKDNGRGFDATQAFENHYGLINMRERAHKVGGTLEVRSEPQKGTEVVFRVEMLELETPT